MRRNVLSEVFLKDMLAGEVILPGETIKRFPGDRILHFVGLVEWAGSPQIENHREEHTGRGTIRTLISTQVVTCPIYSCEQKKLRGGLVRRQNR